MRKIFLFSTFMVVATTLFAAADKPSIDGRAVVAEDGEFPRGDFAKVATYLPGDSLRVTSPSTGKSITVFVTGKLDPSEGIVIRLSKEAAAKLNIVNGMSNQVSIKKREGNEESVFGAAEISIDSATPVAETRGISLPAEEKDDFAENLLVKSVNEDKKSEEPLPEIEDEVLEDFVVEAPASAEESESSELAEDIRGILMPKEEEVNDMLPPDDYEKIASADTATKDILEGVSTDEKDYDPSQGSNAPIEVVDEVAPELATKKTAEAEAVNDEAPALEKEASTSPMTEAVVDVAPVLSSGKEASSEAVTEDLPPAESGAIVLVPAEINPPSEEDKSAAEATKKAEEDRKAVAQAYLERKEEREQAEKAAAEENAPVAIVPVETTPAAAESEDPAVAEDVIAPTESDNKIAKVETPKDVTGFDDFIVPNVDKLKSGNYVQIASLSDKENIKGIVTTFGSKYPIEVVPSTVRKNSYQILIGPLSVDEYGTVLERFKARGYRDAYIRKIK